VAGIEPWLIATFGELTLATLQRTAARPLNLAGRHALRLPA
jgi:hypothetical protein